MKEIAFKGGTISVKPSLAQGWVLIHIKHEYHFGEIIKLSPDQAGELAEMLKGAQACKR